MPAATSGRIWSGVGLYPRQKECGSCWLSRLPTAELFLLNEEDDFPLNLALIAEQQLGDKKLQQA